LVINVSEEIELVFSPLTQPASPRKQSFSVIMLLLCRRRVYLCNMSSNFLNHEDQMCSICCEVLNRRD